MTSPAASNRKRHYELADDLRKSSTAEGTMVREMVQLLFDEAKDALVDATGDDVLRLQGEARSLKRLYTRLTRTPPNETSR